VAQLMTADLYSRLPAVVGQAVLNATLTDALLATGDEQRIAFHLRALSQPLFPPLGQDHAQRHDPLLLPLAAHPQPRPLFRMAGRDQVHGSQGRHLPYSQPCLVHQAKHEPVTGMLDTPREPFHIRIIDVTRQRLSFFYLVLSPDDRVGPTVILGLRSQKLEKVMQTSQPTVNRRRAEPACQLILHKAPHVLPRHFPWWLVYAALEEPQVVNVMLHGTATWIPTIQISFECSDRAVHWLSPGALIILQVSRTACKHTAARHSPEAPA
jgi:hypothetical protein